MIFKGQLTNRKKRKLRRVQKITLFSFCCAVLIFLFTQSEMWDPARSAFSQPLAGQIFVIDPGHGGPDGGAEGYGGLIEKDVTLPISLYLRDLLQQSGAYIRMTRDSDTDLASEQAAKEGRRKRDDLQKRVQLINASEADFLISVHANSIPSPKWSGAQTFYHPGQLKNKEMAELIQAELTRNLQNTTRQAQVSQDIFILRQSNIPSVLVEVGFLSHPEEATLLAQDEYQKQVAFSIYEGILKYVQEQEQEQEME